MQLKVKAPKFTRPNFASLRSNSTGQTAFLVLGVVIPGILLWLAHWLVFDLPAKLAYMEKFLTDFAAEITVQIPDYQGLSSFYSDVLFKLNDAGDGVVFVILGILMFAIAIVLVMLMASRFNMQKMTLGELKITSILNATVIGAVLVSILVAVLSNAFILSFPLQLQQIFWG